MTPLLWALAILGVWLVGGLIIGCLIGRSVKRNEAKPASHPAELFDELEDISFDWPRRDKWSDVA